MMHADGSQAAEPEADASSETQRRYESQSQVDFELEFFDGVVRRAPHYVDVLRIQSSNWAARGNHERSVELDERLAELRPDDASAHYNLACSRSLVGRSGEAVAALRRALELGYPDGRYLLEDRDLQNLQREPQFWLLLKEFGIRTTA